MVSNPPAAEQWDPSNAYSQSNSTESFDHNNKESNLLEQHKKPLLWRRSLASRRFLFFSAMALLLLALVLALSLGLTQGKKSSPPKHQSNKPLPPPPAQLLGPTIDLGYTKVQGLSYPGGISQWLGVRYAQPPIGNLRFAEPQNVTANSTLQMVTQVSQSWKVEYSPFS